MPERVAEVALLILLFAVGLQLGVPLRDYRWRLPLRRAVVSMAAMMAMVAVTGVVLLELSLGAADLLGAILAPHRSGPGFGRPECPGVAP